MTIDFSCEYIGDTDNIIVTVDRDDTAAPRGFKETEISLLDSLFWCDTYTIGEEWCFSNYTMAVTLYNVNRDKCYVLVYSDIDALMRGEISDLNLTAYDPTDDDRDTINEFLGEE